MKRNCCVEGCDRIDNLTRNMCGMHYMRAKSRGEFGDPKCKVKDCVKFAVTRGMCPKHYADFRHEGGLHGHRECSFDGCEKPVTTRGLCNAHYSQLLRGVELKPVQHSGEWGDWGTTTKGYVIRRRTVNGIREHQFQHRFVVEQVLGRELKPNEEIHHKNGNRLDNRYPENLEIWNTSQPKGQRWQDKVEYAEEILRFYAPEKLLE